MYSTPFINSINTPPLARFLLVMCSLVCLDVSLCKSSSCHIAAFNVHTGELTANVLKVPSNDSGDGRGSEMCSKGRTFVPVFPDSALAEGSSTSNTLHGILTSQLDAYASIITLLVPSKIPSQAKRLLQKYCTDEDIDFCVLPSQQFSKKTALSHIALLESTQRNHSKSSRTHSLNLKSMHHLREIKSNSSMMQTVGALLGYLDQNGVAVPADPTQPASSHSPQHSSDITTSQKQSLPFVDDKIIGLESIRSIVCVTVKDLVLIDRATFDSLSIFKVEKHPCVTMKIGAAKESLSLFNIMDRSYTSMGRDKLKEWMRAPTSNVEELEMRHEAIEYFSSNDFLHRGDDIAQRLKGVKDLKRIVHRMHVGKSSVRDWLNLHHSLLNFQKLYNEILRCGMESENRQNPQGDDDCDRLPRLFQIRAVDGERSTGSIGPGETKSQHTILREIEDDIDSCVQLLDRTIDWNESKEQRRLVILPHVDDELDELKGIYDGLDTLLLRVAREEIQHLPEDKFSTIACAYFPQIGFLIQIPRINPQMDSYAEYIHPSLEYRFKTDEAYFYKNQSMHELDTSIGDVHGCIADKEEEVVREIETFLLEHEELFGAITEIVARIDCILSMATLAKEHELVKPKLSASSSVLRIPNGRNILLEQSVQQLIPNHVHCNDNSKRIQILTGPNGSGKSVYLRQIGLIVFMAHIGSFIPCSGTPEIGVVDRIMSRIQSQDSLNSNQSSFSYDLHQINSMLRSYTKKSLLLLDEFGKGTLALDGISLMGAVLNHFISTPENEQMCPRVFVTTHYTELFDYEVIPRENVLIQMLKTQVTQREVESASNPHNQNEQLIYLYKVVPCSEPETSHGLKCAQSVGIPMEILDRAREVLPKLQKGEFVAPLEEGNKQLKSEAECLRVIRCFLNCNLDDENSVDLFLSTMEDTDSKEMLSDNEEMEAVEEIGVEDSASKYGLRTEEEAEAFEREYRDNLDDGMNDE